MIETGTFPRQEIFSHTMAGTPWVNFEWLSQALLYGLVKTAGLPAVLYAKVAAGFLIAALAVSLTRRHGARGPFLLLLATIGFLTLRSRLFERVELASLIIFPLFVSALSKLRSADSAAAKKIPWVLATLMALWCNLHGAFIYGLGVAALMAAGSRWAGHGRDIARRFDQSVVLCALATLATPFGVRLFEVFAEHAAQLSSGPQLIEEWASTSLSANPYFWVLASISLIATVAGLVKKRPTEKFWALPILIFAIWGARHQRNAAYFVFIVLPFLAEIIERGTRDRAPAYLRRMHATAWVPAIASIFLLKPFFAGNPPPPIVVENRFPAGACDFIVKNDIRGTVYNTYQLGGYIEWALGPSHPVFMDGRYIFHPLLVQQRQLDLALAENPDGAAWKTALEKNGVDMAIVDYAAPMFSSHGRTPFPLAWQNLVFPRSAWALVYWDDAAMLFLKRTEKFKNVIARYEYKTLWPYNIAQMQAAIDANMISDDQVSAEIKRHADDVPTSLLRQQMDNRFGAGKSHVE